MLLRIKAGTRIKINGEEYVVQDATMYDCGRDGSSTNLEFIASGWNNPNEKLVIKIDNGWTVG